MENKKVIAKNDYYLGLSTIKTLSKDEEYFYTIGEYQGVKCITITDNLNSRQLFTEDKIDYFFTTNPFTSKKQKKIAVIVGRFQVAELTEGHIHLIKTAVDNYDHTIIFIGCLERDKGLTKDNPLPFQHRKQMILEKFPDVQILAIVDTPSDSIWVNNLDIQIDKYKRPVEIPELLGSRDSFLDIYSNNKGKYQTVVVPEVVDVSGSKQRETIRNTFCNTVDYRKGIIYATVNRDKK